MLGEQDVKLPGGSTLCVRGPGEAGEQGLQQPWDNRAGHHAKESGLPSRGLSSCGEWYDQLRVLGRILSGAIEKNGLER